MTGRDRWTKGSDHPRNRRRPEREQRPRVERAVRGGGGDPRGDDDPEDDTDQTSTAGHQKSGRSCNRVQKPGDRSKPSLSQVRIETFRGNRVHYKDWKKIIEAQRALYRLEDSEMAMLIYLSCQGEPRQILNQFGGSRNAGTWRPQQNVEASGRIFRCSCRREIRGATRSV